MDWIAYPEAWVALATLTALEIVLDIIFSLDSVITAVGMARDLAVMIVAIVIAVGVMMFAAGPIGDFVDRHPTLKMLALINLLLGALLLCYSRPLTTFLGVPWITQGFYPQLLGGVLFGIGLALLVEVRQGPNDPHGLGLGGAIAINLSGGMVLTAWLLFGNLDLPLRGKILLWGIALVLVVLSSLEGLAHLQRRSAGVL